MVLDKKIALMIAIDLQPYSFVEDNGFLSLIHELDAQYKVPCKKTFTEKIIPGIFEEASTKLKNILINIDWLFLTTDLWTSINSESYITLTCHFLYENELKSCFFDTFVMMGQHIAKNIACHIQTILDHWTITKNKIVCITTDNGSDVKAACTILQIRNLSCYAHTLNLVIKDSIKENKDFDAIVKKCSDIVTFFKRSNKAMKVLNNEQVTLGQKVPLKVLKDVETRWNSTYIMLDRFIEIGDALTIALSKSAKTLSILMPEEKDVITEALLLLKPFKDITEKTSGDKYVTALLIIPITEEIQMELTRLRPTLKSSIAQGLEKSLQSVLSNRLFKYEARQEPQITTFCDPRLKKLAFFSTTNAKTAQDLTEDEVKRIIHKNKNEIRTTDSGVSEREKPKGIFKYLQERQKYNK
ncbi:zinc finger BED domain-containing protein 4-like [Solenopsis invicta]|uniref:zinc finger BED domain-containing protein 4-like n=1 Tax=Solenopsis invicta TaxID=13686 RepID=UPI00193CB903|nr:zinc finger BED domain-containing protein 4-like [Solenopsis invicta]